MDILVFHNTILDLLRKERLDIPTHQIIDEFTHLAQLDYYESEYKKYGETQVEQDSLAPFKVSYPFTSDDKGLVPWPVDYGHFISGFTITYDNKRQLAIRHKIQLVQEDRLSEALSNQVRVVSSEYPIATSTGTNLVLFPRATASGKLFYFRSPAAPKLAYTLTGRTLVYDQLNSVQLLWGEPSIRQVMMRVLGYLGLNLNEATIIQFGQLETPQ